MTTKTRKEMTATEMYWATIIDWYWHPDETVEVIARDTNEERD